MTGPSTHVSGHPGMGVGVGVRVGVGEGVGVGVGEGLYVKGWLASSVIGSRESVIILQVITTGVGEGVGVGVGVNVGVGVGVGMGGT